MNRIITQYLTGIALFTLLMAPAMAEPENDPVADLIDRMVSRQAAIDSIVQRIEMTITLEMDGESEQITQDSRLVYQRPNRLVIESEMITLVSDGETLSIIFPAFEHFMRIPIQDRLSATLEEQGEFLGGAILPDVAALLDDDPRAFLKDFAEGVTITVLDDEIYAGHPAWVMHLLIEDEDLGFSEPIKAWIDQETGLMIGLSVEMDLSAHHGEDAIPGIPSRYAIRYKVAERSLNEAIDPGMFSYNTDGFTEVADFEELAEAMHAGIGMPDTDLIGETAPDFELTLLDGETFRLSEQRGKIVLVDFWATWCPPCVESLPYLQNLYKELGNDEIVFVGISVDSPGSEGRVKNMIERFGVTYPVGINEDGDIAMEYGVFNIPTLILVDREGVVLHQKVGFSPPGMEELKAELTRLTQKDETHPDPL